MPYCAVVLCKNKSSKVNGDSHITYHRFPPSDPVTGKCKETWIQATGRPEKWYPTKNSTICSAHFDEECFRPNLKSRRLLPDAVPTLKLGARLVYNVVSGTQSYFKVYTHSPKIEYPVGTLSKKTQKVFASNIETLPDSPSERRLKAEIIKRDETLKIRDKRIRQLLTSRSRLRKKVRALTEILNKLKGRSSITKVNGKVS